MKGFFQVTEALVSPEVLRSFLDSYRLGLASIDGHVPVWKPGVFDDRLREQLEARCSLIELLRVRSFLDLRMRGLVAARRNDLESSRQDFQRAHEALASLRGSEARPLCESLYCAALAYLHYRCDEPDRARELVNRALDLDTDLETRLGIGALYGHRFQLVQNLVHVEARFGNSETATRIGLAMLEQLEGGQGAGPTPHAWNPSDRERLPSELRRALANQIVFELAAIHLRSRARDVETKCYVEHVTSCRCSPEDRAVEAHAWLDFAIAAEAASLEETLELATAYLQSGPGQSPSLWYCVVLQCAERLSTPDSPASRSAASEIERDRPTWPRAPTVLRGVRRSP